MRPTPLFPNHPPDDEEFGDALEYDEDDEFEDEDEGEDDPDDEVQVELNGEERITACLPWEVLAYVHTASNYITSTCCVVNRTIPAPVLPLKQYFEPFGIHRLLPSASIVQP